MIPGRMVEVRNQPRKTISRNKDVKVEIDPNGLYSIENVYVQYFIPEAPIYSVILVHGGGQTGAIWEGTPDGRTGWLQFFLKQNISVYIVDTVERGRSGWCPLQEFWPEGAELRNDNGTWMTFRLGELHHFEKKQPFANQQFPIDAFEQMLMYNVPRWNINNECSAKALSKLINRIGSCHVIAHSQGCGIAMQAVATSSALVNKVVLMEPANFYPVEINNSSKLIEVLILFGDNIASSPFWSEMKNLAIKYTDELNHAHYHTTYIELPDEGIHGNSHALMLDKNNEHVAQYILNWLND